MKLPLTGGCACGAIRYQCTAAPVFALNCHCRDCQRASGGGFSTVLIVPEKAVAVIGAPAWHETRGAEGVSRRGFCPRCGSPLFARGSRGPDFLAIKPASLDEPGWFKPLIDIWMSSAQPWSPTDPSLPKFPRDPPLSP